MVKNLQQPTLIYPFYSFYTYPHISFLEFYTYPIYILLEFYIGLPSYFPFILIVFLQSLFHVPFFTFLTFNNHCVMMGLPNYHYTVCHLSLSLNHLDNHHDVCPLFISIKALLTKITVMFTTRFLLFYYLY